MQVKDLVKKSFLKGQKVTKKNLPKKSFDSRLLTTLVKKFEENKTVNKIAFVILVAGLGTFFYNFARYGSAFLNALTY